METKPEMNTLIVASSVPKTKKVKKQEKKKIDLIIEDDEKIINEFNNKYVIQKIEENKQIKLKKIIEELKLIYPLQDEILIELYNKSISIHQSNIQGNGDFLENDIVVSELTKHNIPFKQQVTSTSTTKCVFIINRYINVWFYCKQPLCHI